MFELNHPVEQTDWDESFFLPVRTLLVLGKKGGGGKGGGNASSDCPSMLFAEKKSATNPCLNEIYVQSYIWLKLNIIVIWTWGFTQIT